jgi:two-component system, cell cycle sensor histidine kinase and response regulator CckA
MAKASVLVVDDEGIVALDISSRLKVLGYQVCGVAATGEDAISKAAADRPDLVLMDIKLKGPIDGIEAAEYLRARLGVPVIFLTAFADEKTLERAKVAEPYGYIIKPFEERELLTAIEMALCKHQAETRLKQSEQWLAITLRSISDAVIAADARGHITLMNSAAEALTGWKQVEAALVDASVVVRIVNEQTGAFETNPIARVLREGVTFDLDSQAVLQARDGREIPIACSPAPIKDDRGAVIGAVLILRDLTGQRRLEEEMLRNQKLESIGVLAGGIAHDFNNLLTPILGNVGLAKMVAGPDSKVSELLTKAEKSCRSAQTLTKRLLTFSTGGAPVKKPTHLRQMIREAARFAVVGSDVRCEFRIPDDLWPAEIDEGLVGQVIGNVIANADQAMPGGGTIRVSCDNVTVHPGRRLPLASGDYVRISIEDQGIGIAPEHLSKIFDPYFTTKRGVHGLGLTVTHCVIRDHAGHIDVRSTLGIGTTFDIYLPAAAYRDLPRVAPANEELIRGTGKILIMDDEDAVRDIAGAILTSAGYEVAYAEDGAKAIELYRVAKTTDAPFDAVVMDLTVVGGMGGQQAMTELLKVDPQVKGIVSSGYSSDPILANHKRHGFSGAISKPYDAREFCQTIFSVISKSERIRSRASCGYSPDRPAGGRRNQPGGARL